MKYLVLSFDTINVLRVKKTNLFVTLHTIAAVSLLLTKLGRSVKLTILIQNRSIFTRLDTIFLNTLITDVTDLLERHILRKMFAAGGYSDNEGVVKKILIQF